VPRGSPKARIIIGDQSLSDDAADPSGGCPAFKFCEHQLGETFALPGLGHRNCKLRRGRICVAHVAGLTDYGLATVRECFGNERNVIDMVDLRELSQ
jgi:hypothetical protein